MRMKRLLVVSMMLTALCAGTHGLAANNVATGAAIGAGVGLLAGGASGAVTGAAVGAGVGVLTNGASGAVRGGVYGAAGGALIGRRR